MKKLLLISLFLSFINLSYAFPKQIIIIRHADKLEQTQAGPTLSAKGQVRAIKFADYFLNKFGEPDNVIAANPSNYIGKNSSIRELQTVAPLVNILSTKHPQTGFPILHPFESADYKKLVKFVLQEEMFSGKTVLICWNHTKIPQLAEKLGVTQKIDKWAADNYDSVYVLKYDDAGKIKLFTVLNKQYPVKFTGNWNELDKRIS